MGSSPSKSFELRQVAQKVLQELNQNPSLASLNREGLETSLVRQWLTYQGTAALHLGHDLYFLSLVFSPLGAYSVQTQANRDSWIKALREDWKVREEDLPAMIDRLNVGQSAEVVNQAGVRIRWWVNPREKTSGVEEQEPPTSPPVPRHAAILGRVSERLEMAFSGTIPPREIPVLAKSVMEQWDRCEGVAALFTETTRLTMVLENQAGGGFAITVGEVPFPTRKWFEKSGIPAADVVRAMAQINLGQTYTFEDDQGNPVVFWQEPHKSRFVTRKLDSSPQPDGTTPLACSVCRGVLGDWSEGIRIKSCRFCGEVVRRP